MRVALFSPLNPVKSGISDYTEELLPEFSKHMDLDIFIDPGYTPSAPGLNETYRIFPFDENRFEAGRYDAILYHMGNFYDAHRKGSKYVDKQVKLKTSPSDIVITTNSGYPLDRDLYQAVKAMSTAEPVIKEGGVVIVASECRDGVGHPEFKKLVQEHTRPSEILETINTPEFSMVDQWEAQILARVLTRCNVIMVSDGLDAQTVSSMHMDLASSIEKALEQAINMIGRAPEITVIPYGPSTIVTTGD